MIKILRTNLCVSQNLVLRLLETLRALCHLPEMLHLHVLHVLETLRILWYRVLC
jgi:hypothetical protein